MTSAKPRPPLIPGETRAYPVLPLRDIVVFPHMIVPLFVGVAGGPGFEPRLTDRDQGGRQRWRRPSPSKRVCPA